MGKMLAHENYQMFFDPLILMFAHSDLLHLFLLHLIFFLFPFTLIIPNPGMPSLSIFPLFYPCVKPD